MPADRGFLADAAAGLTSWVLTRWACGAEPLAAVLRDGQRDTGWSASGGLHARCTARGVEFHDLNDGGIVALAAWEDLAGALEDQIGDAGRDELRQVNRGLSDLHMADHGLDDLAWKRAERSLQQRQRAVRDRAAAGIAEPVGQLALFVA